MSLVGGILKGGGKLAKKLFSKIGTYVTEKGGVSGILSGLKKGFSELTQKTGSEILSDASSYVTKGLKKVAVAGGVLTAADVATGGAVHETAGTVISAATTGVSAVSDLGGTIGNIIGDVAKGDLSGALGELGTFATKHPGLTAGCALAGTALLGGTGSTLAKVAAAGGAFMLAKSYFDNSQTSTATSTASLTNTGTEASTSTASYELPSETTQTQPTTQPTDGPVSGAETPSEPSGGASAPSEPVWASDPLISGTNPLIAGMEEWKYNNKRANTPSMRSVPVSDTVSDVLSSIGDKLGTNASAESVTWVGPEPSGTSSTLTDSLTAAFATDAASTSTSAPVETPHAASTSYNNENDLQWA